MPGTLTDAPRLRNKHHVFTGRKDAGRYLAAMLSKYAHRSETMILAIPSGGVPVGLEMSGKLDLPMDLVITRKIQIPGNTEAGFGAMTMNGKAFINRELLDSLHLSEAQVNMQMEKVRGELQRRNVRFRNNRPPPDLKEKVVILTDDGIASGFTMLAAIDMAVDHGAKRIVVAVPTAPISSIFRIGGRVEEIFCANVQDYGAFAVADAYKRWRDLEPEEVVEMLQQCGLPTTE